MSEKMYSCKDCLDLKWIGNQESVGTFTYCNYPSYSVLIDWNGDVGLCCNDWQRKKEYGKNIVGKDILAEMPKSPDIILNNKFDESINILSISLLKKIKEIVKN
mgnify:CR=1 FL=1